MALVDDLDELQKLHTAGALSEAEFLAAKRALISENPTDTSETPPHSGAATTRWKKWATLVGTTVLAAGAILIAVHVLSPEKEVVDRRTDTECQQISDDLLAQNKPMSELYPTLRGMGCSTWLDEQFEGDPE